MARLKSVSSWLANFGKSIGYSAKDVLAEAAPNTKQIVEDAGEEIYNFKEFLTDYRSKSANNDKFLEYTKLQKQATDIISSTINDIKTGNFAAPKDDFGDMFGSSDFDFDSSDYADSEDKAEDGSDVRKLNLSTDAKATAKATVQGNILIAETLENSSKAQMMTQVNTAKAMMNTTNNMGMIVANRIGSSLSETNKRLDQINSNLVGIMKFMNENQSKVNQAHMDYLKASQEYMKIQLEIYSPKKKKKQSAQDAFLSAGEFNLPSYVSMVKENLKSNSSLGQLQAMLGMGSMMGGMMGSMGGAGNFIRPTQALMNMAMKKIIPKKLQKAITRADSLIPQALMGGISTLSDYRDQPGILGILGSIFGATARQQRSFRLGNYNKGAVPWDGKSKRALEVVIPHYLALIEDHTSNIPKTKAGSGSGGPKFYDYETGTFRTRKDIRERLKERSSDAFRGGTSDSLSFFESRFVDDEDMQEKAKSIMWKHMQPLVYGEKKLTGEDTIRKAAKEYAKELQGMGLSPFEISQLVIYFKGSITKLRQYMSSVELSESEQELFNERGTDGFGFIKGGFLTSDLGNVTTKTDLARKQKRDQEKAERAAEEIKEALDKAKGNFFGGNKKEKNKTLENLKYSLNEGVGSLKFRNDISSRTEALGLSIVEYLSGQGDIDPSKGVMGFKDSFKNTFNKYKYDHFTVADVRKIMRDSGYNPDQYNFITADMEGGADGLFGYAVLRFKYGRRGCLRVIKQRNIVYNSISKKYMISKVDPDERVVTSRDLDKDFQPATESEIYTMDKGGVPRDGNTQYAMDLEVLATDMPLQKAPKDERSFVQKVKDSASEVLTGTSEHKKKMQAAEKEAKERWQAEVDKRKEEDKKGTSKDSEDEGHGFARLGGSPRQKRDARKKREAAAARSGSNTNEESRKRSEERNKAKIRTEELQRSIEELNKASEVITADTTGKDKTKKSLLARVNSVLGFNKKTGKAAAVGGLLGALFLPGGLIGGSLLGAAVGIASTAVDFKKFFFGSKTVDDDGTVHYDKTGILGQWQNMFVTEGKDLVRSQFSSVKDELVLYTKAQFAPVIEAFRGIDPKKNPVTKTLVSTIQTVGGGILNFFLHPMQTLNNMAIRVASIVVSTAVKSSVNVLKTTAKAGIWALSKPAQLVADFLKARKSANPFETFANIRKDRKTRKKAGKAAKRQYQFYRVGNIAKGITESIEGGSAKYFKERMKNTKNAQQFYGEKYNQTRAQVDEIRKGLSSNDPLTKQNAIMSLLPKDEKTGAVLNDDWNALPRDDDGLIDSDALDQFLYDNQDQLYRKLNSKEQALAGLKATADYTAKVKEGKNQKKLDKVVRGFARSDAYQYKKLTPEEYEKRRKKIEKYLPKDEKGKITDELYNKIQNAEDLDKWTKNRDAFAKEVAERESIAKAKAAEEEAKKKEENAQNNQNALALGNLIALTGVDLDSSLISNDTDNTTSILTAVSNAVRFKKEHAEDTESDKAKATALEEEKKKRQAAEDKADAEREELKKKEAAETEAIQSAGRNKVADDTALTDEKDNEGETGKATISSESDKDDEDEGILGKLTKFGSMVGTAGLAAYLLFKTDVGKQLLEVAGTVIKDAVGSVGSSIGGWMKDSITGILPTGNENQKVEMTKEQLDNINPDYVGETTTTDENGNEVVKLNPSSKYNMAFPTFAGKIAVQDLINGGKSSKALVSGAKAVGGFLSKNKKQIGKIAKGGLTVLDKVTDHIPIVKTVKKIGKLGVGAVKTTGKIGSGIVKGVKNLFGKGATEAAESATDIAARSALEEAAEGAAKEAAEKAAAKAAAGSADDAVSTLTKAGTSGKFDNIVKMAKELLEKFSKNSKLASLIKGTKVESIIKCFTNAIDDIVKKVAKKANDSGLTKIIDKAATTISGATASQGFKYALSAVTTIWSAATGALDAANLFMVNDGDVDVTMRTVSAIMYLLVDFLPVAGPIFDCFSTVCEYLGLPNFKRELSVAIYKVLYKAFGLEGKGVETVEQRQSDFEKEYEAYLKDNGLTKDDLSIVEYNEIANQTVFSKVTNTIGKGLKSAGNWIANVFGAGGSKSGNASATTQTAGSTYLTGGASTATASVAGSSTGVASSYLGGGKGNSKSKGASLGHGTGMRQDDPSYASMSLGKLPDGSPANMKNSGCGPTALANAVAAVGGDANPGEVGNYAKRNGMLTDGGANAKLFTEGARKYGLSGREISNIGDVDMSLSNGDPVIMSGKSIGYGSGGSLYTKAGHIVTVLGKTDNGMYRVDDGEGETIVSGDTLQNGATHAYSMERLGGRLPEGDRPGAGDVITASSSKASSAMQDNGTTIQHGAYYFAMNDPTWGSLMIPGKDTIGNVGCVHTSGAMAASTILGKPIDPGTFLNTYGDAANVADLQESGVKVTRYPAGGSMYNGASNAYASQYLDTIVNALKQRKMVILYGQKNGSNMYNFSGSMGGPHAVLATGLDANGNIIINEPYATSVPYGQGSTGQKVWPATTASIGPMYWAEVVETPDGKGAPATMASTSGMSVANTGSATGATGTTGATSSTGTATASSTTGATSETAASGAEIGEDSSSSGNVFDAIFGAMGNIVNKVGNRLSNAVMSGKSYEQVKAEEDASSTATSETAAQGFGSGGKKVKLERYPDGTIAPKSTKNDVGSSPAISLGHGPGDSVDSMESTATGYMDTIVELLSDIRDNTNGIGSGSRFGGEPAKSSAETGKNTNKAKENKKSDTQKKQSAMSTAKSRLSDLNNGLNGDSLGRKSLRSTYAKLGAF